LKALLPSFARTPSRKLVGRSGNFGIGALEGIILPSTYAADFMATDFDNRPAFAAWAW
jgi:hypothetical protein